MKTKTVTATPEQHRAACVALHANRDRKTGLAPQHRTIIDAIDHGTLHIVGQTKKMTGLSTRLDSAFR